MLHDQLADRPTCLAGALLPNGIVWMSCQKC